MLYMKKLINRVKGKTLNFFVYLKRMYFFCTILKLFFKYKFKKCKYVYKNKMMLLVFLIISIFLIHPSFSV